MGCESFRLGLAFRMYILYFRCPQTMERKGSLGQHLHARRQVTFKLSDGKTQRAATK